MANIITLKGEAEKEGYSYFNENIRPLVMKENGEVDYSKNVLWDNDVDAFRHAYVSGAYALEYNEDVSEKLGVIQEHIPLGGSSSPNSEASKNMDYWNNEVGRKYGKKAKTRERFTTGTGTSAITNNDGWRHCLHLESDNAVAAMKNIDCSLQLRRRCSIVCNGKGRACFEQR